MSRLKTQEDIIAFLEENGYRVTKQDTILIIQDESGLNVFTIIGETQIEFMLDVCPINDLEAAKLQEIYEKILDQNTEILPTCFGLDSKDASDKHIVLVDSLATENLDENELLLALDSFSVNADVAHDLLLPYFKKAAS